MKNKKTAMKPRPTRVEYCGGSMLIKMDIKMNNAWLGFIPADLKQLKRLHRWIGKAIAYLETKEGV